MIKKIKIWRDISAKRQNIVTVRTMITLKFGIIFLVRGNQMQLQIQSENTNTKFGQICPVQVLHSAPVSDKGAASNLRSKPLPFQSWPQEYHHGDYYRIHEYHNPQRRNAWRCFKLE